MLSPLGGAATLTGFEIFTVATLLFLAYATYEFTWAIGGRWAGIIAVVIVLTRPETIEQLVNTNKDLLFVGLVLLAGAYVINDAYLRPKTVLGLLAVAGLIRPEAWILAGVFWLWMLYETRSEALKPVMVGLLIAAPLTWAMIDLAFTGDVLHTAHHGKVKAEAIEEAGFIDRFPERSQPKGTFEKLTGGLDRGFPGTIGWAATIAALMVFGTQILLGLRKGKGWYSAGVLLTPLVFVIAVTVGTIIAALFGFGIPGRFLLLGAFAMICVAAAAVGGAKRSPIAATAIVVLVAGILAGMPGDVDEWQDDFDQRIATRAEADRLVELAQRAETSAAIDACPVTRFAGTNRARVSMGRAVIALELGIPVGQITLGQTDPVGEGSSAFSRGPMDGIEPRDPPEEISTSLRNGQWFFASRCSGAP